MVNNIIYQVINFKLKYFLEKSPADYEKESVFYNQSTAECARLSTGGCLELVSLIAKGYLRNGFGIVRPPGHHAEMHKAM